ncbi:MAG TPA: heparinase II/III family protein [Xanthobacteraceae bacterium]|nr:heparinase II/III family protein [Xanthobacteraceae bacterium]
MGRFNAHPMLRWRFSSAIADRLLIAPQDLRTADPTRASEIYSGRFAFAGKVVICDGRSPFEIEPPSEEWSEQLLGFGWLRHLRAADSSITRANARALVGEWIALQGAFDTLEGWRPDIVARRIISWLCQAPLVLHDADMKFYRRFLRNLTRQVRYLQRTVNATRDGLPRMQAVIALTYAALCMQGQARLLKNITRKLSDELGRQVLPDGGHASRNPGALVELLLDLLPLRQAFAARNVPPPPALNNAIDRMMPMLRFFRHGDGNFALFNGMGPTRTELVSTVLAYDDARGNPVANAPHSGYQRVQAADALLIVDAGPPPPLPMSAEAHAGCLSFELSARNHRIVVNCGLPAVSRSTWRHVARATAAHSTVTFNDTSSCRFMTSESLKGLLGVPILSGPTDVQVARQERDGGVMLRLSHDGYLDRFGVVHHRTLRLSADGKQLDGEDTFAGAHGEAVSMRRGDAFAVRFHLHPTLKASRHSDGHGALLVLPNKEVWTFDAYEETVELEESVYLAGPDGPRRAVQIVIHGRARDVPRVHWTFAHQDAQEPARRASREEPELPL